MKLSTSKIEKLMRINQYNKSVCQVEFLTATNDYTNVCNEYELALESAEKLTHWKSMTSRSGELDLELYSAALAFEHVAIAKLDEARDSKKESLQLLDDANEIMTQASLALKLSNNREIKLKGEIDIRLEKNQNEQLTDIWLNSKGQI